MFDTKRKLTKVVMEFDNGEKEFLYGEDAVKWLDALNNAIVLDYVHGGNTQKMLKDIVWKKVI